MGADQTDLLDMDFTRLSAARMVGQVKYPVRYDVTISIPELDLFYLYIYIIKRLG